MDKVDLPVLSWDMAWGLMGGKGWGRFKYPLCSSLCAYVALLSDGLEK